MRLVTPVSATPPALAAGHPAPRPTRGRRLRVGLLHNCKPNGDVIVQSAYDWLEKRGHGASCVFVVKHAAGVAMNDNAFAALEGCDLVLSALSC